MSTRRNISHFRPRMRVTSWRILAVCRVLGTKVLGTTSIEGFLVLRNNLLLIVTMATIQRPQPVHRIRHRPSACRIKRQTVVLLASIRRLYGPPWWSHAEDNGDVDETEPFRPRPGPKFLGLSRSRPDFRSRDRSGPVETKLSRPGPRSGSRAWFTKYFTIYHKIIVSLS